MTKIIGLEIENVKRVSAVELSFDKDQNLVVLGGRNEQGKSSTLDALEYLFRGKRAMPAEPVRRGAKKGKVAAELDDGRRIKRTLSARGADKLTVVDRDGNKVTDDDGVPITALQSYLDALVGPTSFFDPEEFSRMDTGKQNETLRRLIGLDTAALDAERAEVFAERKDANKDVKRVKAQLEAAPHHTDAPDEEVSVADRTDELERRQTVVDANDEIRDKVEPAHENAEDAREDVQTAKDDIARLEAELEVAKTHLDERLIHSQEATKKAEEAQAAADALVDPDLDEVREQLRTAEDTNRQVRDNAARAALAKELRAAEDKAEELTDKLRNIDEQKSDMLAEAKMPIEGLGFDDDGVTYQGFSLGQASQSARLRVSAAIGVAMNPGVQALLIRDGSRLDGEGLKLLEEVANEADTLMLVEMVTRNAADEAMCTYVIEDGAVRETEVEAAANLRETA